MSAVALSTAILAVLAAITGLLSGKHANEAMMSQIEASDQWSYYQAKSIKASVLEAKMSLSGVTNEQDRAKATKYQEEQADIQKEARTKEAEAKEHFHRHEVFAPADSAIRSECGCDAARLVDRPSAGQISNKTGALAGGLCRRRAC